MNSQYQQQQQQMTPFYAPAASNGQTENNANGYYNNYGFAAPPPQEAWNNGETHYFASPPAPTWQQVNQEFGSQAVTTGGSFDLLDSTYGGNNHNQAVVNTAAPLSDYEIAARLATEQIQQENTAMTSRRDDSDIPLDIIASQERAMEEARKRRNNNNTGSSSSRALTTTSSTNVMVPRSQNPMGSDSVHPHRSQWKKTRGSKTVAGATGGAILGGIAFGPAFPVGMVLGGAVGGYATNKLSKQGERRAQRKWEQSSVQEGAVHSLTAKSHATVV